MPLNSSVRENGTIVITGGDRLTIENAADFLRVARDALDSSTSVAIEFEPTLAIDITGLQILCSACKSAALSGKTFSYSGNQPPALTDLIASCGAERHAVCKHNNDSTCTWFGGGN
jgi:anti-anti-sigma regulatory factor